VCSVDREDFLTTSGVLAKMLVAHAREATGKRVAGKPTACHVCQGNANIWKRRKTARGVYLAERVCCRRFSPKSARVVHRGDTKQERDRQAVAHVIQGIFQLFKIRVVVSHVR
jgi:hypothetical protein